MARHAATTVVVGASMIGNSTSLCDDGADPFIERYFLDCVYGQRDAAGFYIGLLSIVCWIFAQAPQLYANYKRKSAEALSPYFLAEWLLGDTSNLLGALLKGDQPQTVVFTAEYFIVMDCILMVQYVYYMSLQKRRGKLASARRAGRHHDGHHHHHHHHHHRSHHDGATTSHDQDTRPNNRRRPLITLGSMAAVTIVYTFSNVEIQQPMFLSNKSDAGLNLVGSILAYMSCILYLFSRISQIYKNWKRKSADGLSASMFATAVSANLCYGISVILRSPTWEYFMSSLPWLIGSLGTVFLDAIILTQTLKSSGIGVVVQGSSPSSSVAAVRASHGNHDEGDDLETNREPLLS